MSTVYHVYTVGYCGMRLPHGEYDDLEDANLRAKQRILHVEKLGCLVTPLEPMEWEIGEPEDCAMVPDFCGYLKIVPVKDTVECRGCNADVPKGVRYCEDCL